MDEIWKTITDFPKYEVSNKGYIRNIKTQRILKPAYNNGYFQVALRNNKKSYTREVHTIVAKEFLPNTQNYNYVKHIDGNNTNNCVDNLKWIENKSVKKYRDSQPERSVHRNYRVNQYDTNNVLVNSFGTAVEACKTTGIDITGISKAARGKIKTAGGYIWRYE